MTLLPIPIRGESSLAATLTRETNRINNSDFHGFGCTCVELHQSPMTKHIALGTDGSKQDQGPRSQTSDKTFFNFCFAKTDFRTNWPTLFKRKTFGSGQGQSPLTPGQGLCSWTLLGLCPQTTVIGLRSAFTMWPQTLPLNPPVGGRWRRDPAWASDPVSTDCVIHASSYRGA